MLVVQHRKVFVGLIPLVVVLDGDEERLAETEAVNEVEGGIRQRPATDDGAVVGRGRSSRAYWKRTSLSSDSEMVEMIVPVPAFDLSFSMALALRPQESTSKVPFACSAQV